MDDWLAMFFGVSICFYMVCFWCSLVFRFVFIWFAFLGDKLGFKVGSLAGMEVGLRYYGTQLGLLIWLYWWCDNRLGSYPFL